MTQAGFDQSATFQDRPVAATTDSAQLNFQVQGINFQPVDATGNSLNLQIPPIPAIMVIPGNIGFLDQFFSVQIFTENGSPQGSNLIVSNCQATLDLPVGPSGIPVTNTDYPGDAPLDYAAHRSQPGD